MFLTESNLSLYASAQVAACIVQGRDTPMAGAAHNGLIRAFCWPEAAAFLGLAAG